MMVGHRQRTEHSPHRSPHAKAILFVPFFFAIVSSTKLALSIDSGQVHVETSFTTAPSHRHPLLLLINNHTYRGAIFKHYQSNNAHVVCAESSPGRGHDDATPPFDWCMMPGAVTADATQICICTAATTTMDPTDPTNHHPTVLGHVSLHHAISWDSIQSIVSHQTRVIDTWSITAHGKHPPVDRIKCCMPIEEFNQKYFNLGLPVIIENMVNRWNAPMKWTTEYFRTNFGHLKVHVRDPTDPTGSATDNFRVETTVQDYMNFLDNETLMSSSHQRHMVGMLNQFHSHQQFRQLLIDDIISVPEYFYPLPTSAVLEGENEQPWRFTQTPMIWLGPRGTHTPLHHDVRSSFNCQIRGNKRWHLVHARQRNLLNFLPVMDNYCMENQDERPLWQVDDKKYPLFKRVTIWNTTIHSGEAIFLPSGLFHDVTCTTTNCMTLSLTHFNEPMVIKEHKWISKTAAIGATTTLSKKLTMGTACKTGDKSTENQVPVCPTRKDVTESIAYQSSLRPAKNSGIWTIVNTTPRKIKVIDPLQNNQLLFVVEGKSTKDVPGHLSRPSTVLVATTEQDSLLAILSNPSNNVLIGRSMIHSCTKSPASIVEQLHTVHSDTTAVAHPARLRWTGLEVSPFGLFIPLKTVFDFAPFEYVKAAITLGINHFHVQLNELVDATRKNLDACATLTKQLGQLWDGTGKKSMHVRDSLVLICHVNSRSKKSIATTMVKALELMGAKYCDVLVVDGYGGQSEKGRRQKPLSKLEAEWFIKHELTLHVGENIPTQDVSKILVSVKGIGGDDLLEAMHVLEIF